jgi:hypothetical protein
MLCLSPAGPDCYDLYAHKGRLFAGIIAKRPNGTWAFYYNSGCTKGSARRFATIQDVIAFVIDRRIKKGWRV